MNSFAEVVLARSEDRVRSVASVLRSGVSLWAYALNRLFRDSLMTLTRF
jgi:hypothetical protein